MVKGCNCMSYVFRYHKNIFKKSLRLFDQEAEVSPDDQMQQFGRGPWVFLDEDCKVQAECPVYSKDCIGLSCHLSHSLSLPLLCKSCISEVLGTNPTHLSMSAFCLHFFPRYFLSLPLYSAVSDILLDSNVEFLPSLIVFCSFQFFSVSMWLIFKFPFSVEISILSSIFMNILILIIALPMSNHYNIWVFWVFSFLFFFSSSLNLFMICLVVKLNVRHCLG